MTNVEHILRKGTGMLISWFPVSEESELPVACGMIPNEEYHALAR